MVHVGLFNRLPLRSPKGFSVAELMIAMALLAFVMLSFGFFVMDFNSKHSGLFVQNRAVLEINSLYNTLSEQLRRGTYIYNTSHNRLLIFDYLDANNTVRHIQYRITRVSGSDYLEVSTNSGASWGSPYNIALATDYRLDSPPTAEFIYCGYHDRCTRFPDSDFDGDRDGMDAAASVAPFGGGSVLSGPKEAYKVVLYNFQFNRQKGDPNVTVPWPAQAYLQIGPVSVLSTADELRDFATTSNVNISANFTPRAVDYDYVSQRLVVAGINTVDANNLVYFMHPDGALIGTPFDSTTNYTTYMDVAAKDSTSSLLLVTSANRLIDANLSTGAFTSDVNLNATINPIRGVAYDPSTPTDCYLIGTEVASGNVKIFRRTTASGAAVSNWSVPAGLTNPGGMTMDPTTGDFYVVQNTVLGAGASRTIEVFRITQASPTTVDKFSINLALIGSSSTSADGTLFGLTFDPMRNRLFLSDSKDKEIYEIIPPRFLSAQS